jgi:hypothetical protein
MTGGTHGENFFQKAGIAYSKFLAYRISFSSKNQKSEQNARIF